MRPDSGVELGGSSGHIISPLVLSGTLGGVKRERGSGMRSHGSIGGYRQLCL